MFGNEYYHHGIFISFEEGIIDFGANKEKAQIRKVDLLEFTCFGTRRLVRIIYLENQCLQPELVVKRAKELSRNPNEWKRFDIETNNCEHFATECKIGVAISSQVKEYMEKCINDPLQRMKYTIIVSVAKVGSLSGSSGSGSSGSSGSCSSGSSGSGSSGSCGSSNGSSGSCVIC